MLVVFAKMQIPKYWSLELSQNVLLVMKQILLRDYRKEQINVSALEKLSLMLRAENVLVLKLLKFL
jgi:hypothetical protein